EMRAARHHALHAVASALDGGALLPVVLAPVHAHLDVLAGQRVVDEDHLAGGVVRDALRVEVERLDAQPLTVLDHLRDYPGRPGASLPDGLAAACTRPARTGRAATLRAPGESLGRGRRRRRPSGSPPVERSG